MATTQPTKDEWAQINKRLKVLYSSVFLRVDGYTVTLRLGQVSQFRNAIGVWVNGWFKGEWLINNTDEARRFYPLRSKDVCTPAVKKRLVKAFGKKQAATLGAFKKIEHYETYWTSFTALKRHLIANNEHIELIVDGDDA